MYRNAGDFPRSTNEEEKQANIKRASCLDDEYNNPCLKEHSLSYKCLSDTEYDRKKCEVYFENYKRCKTFWSNVAADRKRKGIKPALPWPDERDKVKYEYQHKIK